MQTTLKINSTVREQPTHLKMGQRSEQTPYKEDTEMAGKHLEGAPHPATRELQTETIKTGNAY